MDLGIGGPVAAPLQPAANVNTGDHSEAMFHRFDDFKKLMGPDRMGFLYKRWMEHQCSDPARRGQWRSQPVWGEGWQEGEADDRGGLWQLKIINFGFIWDAKGRQGNLTASGNALKTAADQVVQRLQAAWTSKAGDAAAEKFTDLGKAAADYASQVQKLSTELEGAWQATRHVVNDLADFATKSDLGGKPMMDRYGADGASDDHGNSERGNWSSRMDELNKAVQFGTWEWGPEAREVAEDTWGPDLGWSVKKQTAESVRQPGQVYIEADGSNMWSNEICNWLDDMAHCYYLTIGNFRRRVEEAVKTVSDAWQRLSNGADHLKLDPFGQLVLGPAQGTDDGTKNPNPNDNGRGDRTGTGTGTGTSSTPMPPVQPPPMPPVQPVDDTTSPSGVDPIVEPPPGSPQDQAKDQETVTIEDGDRKISVQSPDGEGHVKVTVDDGTGKPKTYDLDFGAGTGAQAGQTLPGQADDGRPQTLPGQPEGRPQTLPAEETPPGTPGVQEPADAVQQVQAGPDGKAVVHDGNLTITAERPPGTPDQIKITIDDGTGKPTTYVVDYSDPSNPSAAQQAGFTGQPVQGGRPTAEPMSFAAPQQAGFTEPLAAEAQSATGPQSGFAAPVNGGFADPATGAQSGGFAAPVNGGFAEPGSGAPDTGTSTQGGFTEPVSSESRGFAQPASDGFAEPTHQGGFAEPVSGDVRRFAGGFTDATTGQQTGSLDAVSSESHGFDQSVSSSTAPQSAGFSEPLDGGFADAAAGFTGAASGQQAGSLDPLSGEGQGFDQALSSTAPQSAGFTEPLDGGFADQSGGFASPQSDFADAAASFTDVASGQQAGSLDPLSGEGQGFDQALSSTAPQSAGFTEPLDGGFADQSGGFASPQSDFADAAAGFTDVASGQQAGSLDPLSGEGQGFDEPLDGDFTESSTSQHSAFSAVFDDQTAGFTEPSGNGFTTEPTGQSDAFTDPSASADPAIGGFQPAAQPDAFDPAAAQAIDADEAGAFDQGAATAQASGFAAGPSIGDDLFRDWSTGLSDSDLGEYQSPESAPFERSEQLWTEPAAEEEQAPMGTSAQAHGFDVGTGDDSGMESVWSTQGDLFDDTPDATDTGGEEIAPAAGEAGLAAVPDNGPSQPHPSNTATSAGGMGGGMPMMGMGGAGGGGNTDQERGPSAWRTAGDLFDDGPVSAADRISTVLGDDES